MSAPSRSAPLSSEALGPAQSDADAPPLEFVACGSVDDGKSTLIGRLLLDSGALHSDHLGAAKRSGALDLASITDGLIAEREQGITIDVARRFFRSPRRGFVLADAPGHERHTRNMATACSVADAAVVLVDATKLDWRSAPPVLLEQTRRHAWLCSAFDVPSVVFAVNKLDAVEDPAAALSSISSSIESFCQASRIRPRAVVPVSALLGLNVAGRAPAGWAGFDGPCLLEILEGLPTLADEARARSARAPLALPAQWIQRRGAPQAPGASARVAWGRVERGVCRPGLDVEIFPSGEKARVAASWDRSRRAASVEAGWSAGVGLDREVDCARGDWILETGAGAPARGRRFLATCAWLGEEPLAVGRDYWARHGCRWVKGRIQEVRSLFDLAGGSLPPGPLSQNSIAQVIVELREPIPFLPYKESRALGAMALVDASTDDTCAAIMIQEAA